MIIIASKEEKELLKQLRSLKDWQGADTIPGLTAEAIRLKQQISDLEISRDKKQEDFDRRERELRHMVGLEKIRQAQELDLAKKQVAVEVKEKALADEQKRFAEQLKFNTERFNQAEQNLKDILGEIIKRLPNVNMEVTRKTR